MADHLFSDAPKTFAKETFAPVANITQPAAGMANRNG